jgi:hypothetical protein
MPQNIISYAYKDYGSNYFDDFKIEFEAAITASQTGSQVVVCAVSDQIGPKSTFVSNNDAIAVALYNDGGNITAELKCQNTDDGDTYAFTGTTLSLTYFTFERSGTDTYLYIYSDSQRQNLTATLSITSETGAKQYLYATASQNAGSSPQITGYTKDFVIISH